MSAGKDLVLLDLSRGAHSIIAAELATEAEVEQLTAGEDLEPLRGLHLSEGLVAERPEAGRRLPEDLPHRRGGDLVGGNDLRIAFDFDGVLADGSTMHSSSAASRRAASLRSVHAIGLWNTPARLAVELSLCLVSHPPT